MSRSCDTIYGVPNLSAREIQDVYDSINQVSHQTRVDHRFVLAVIMQETKGCARAKTSVSPDGTVRNPGIMQDFKGPHTCNEDGKVQTPCPKAQILGMIQDGVVGPADIEGAHGLAIDINLQADVEAIEFAEAYYRAARLYNSGVIDDSQDLGAGSATHCYASDIANRLTGWTDAESTCTLDD